MAKLTHEVWVHVDENGRELPGCCLAGPMGDGFRKLLAVEPGARLVTTFEAGSHFEAMTIYNRLLEREEYTTDEPLAYEPYPEEWLTVQRGSGPQRPPARGPRPTS